MTLREVLNLTALCAVFLALVSLLLKAGDHPGTFGWSGLESLYYGTCILPWILLLITGEAYGIAFFISFYYGGGKASRGHSLERAWARAGKGREVAHALLWRDRVHGDNAGLMAVIEFAQLDESLKPEVLRAALRLLGRRRLSRGDRDHVGRLLMMAKVSVGQPVQKPHR